MLVQALCLERDAFALDAACASSLYAIRLACDRLAAGTADAMLAGAVCCADTLLIHQGFAALQALSRSGTSRPFGAQADGLLPAEGCAFVLLKRLRDAERDGDPIHGVIRAVGLSNDGRGSGLLVPSQAGQERAIRQAYERSAIDPADIAYVECHATGTLVGDATELASMRSVLGERSETAIGSLKANLGHLITVAGVAGLIKVLEGLRRETLPAHPDIGDVVDAVAGSGLRLLEQSEPWVRGRGPRRAAVSAFGFGGNNAHLVVEEHVKPSFAIVVPDLPGASDEPIAIVGVGIRMGELSSRAEVLAALVGGTRFASAAEDVVIPLDGLAFPPRDLEGALGQHTMVLASAFEAIDETTALPADRTAVIIGIEADPDVARLGCRWRVFESAQQLEPDLPWLAEARAALDDPMDASTVLGAMPNMPANRISWQFDLHGPSFTVSSGEDSGIDAIDLAVDALQRREVDAALAGAVDLSVHPVHEHAARARGSDDLLPTGDGAVVLVLKRLRDAEAAEDRIYATIGGAADDAEMHLTTAAGADSLTSRFGHAFAADGALYIAVAALCVHHRIRLSGAPWLAAAPRTATAGTSGRRRTIVEVPWASREPEAPGLSLSSFAADDEADLLARLERGAPGGEGRMRAVLVAGSDEELTERRRRACEHLRHGAPPGSGVQVSRASLGGELAFVFTAAGAAYRGMGASLLHTLPELADHDEQGLRELVRAGLDWAYTSRASGPPTPSQFLWGSSTLCQLHARLTRDLLGLRPTAMLGCSSGETATLFHGGAWTDYPAMYRDINDSGLMDRELGGSFAALQRRWRAPASWRCVHVTATVDRVRAGLEGEDRAHLAIINSPRHSVIAGEASAIARVVMSIGSSCCAEIDYRLVCHVPEVEEVASTWHAIHTRDVTPTPGIRYYANAVGGAYVPTREGTGRVLLAQALDTVDFAATIRAAYEDGVRVFVEHGPQNACSGFIAEALRGREHLAVSLDRRGAGIEATLNAIAALAAAGVPLDLERLGGRIGSQRKLRSGPTIRLPARWKRPAKPAVPRTLTATASRAQTPVTAPGFSELTRLHTGVVQRLAGLHTRYLSSTTSGLATVPGPPIARRSGDGPIFDRDALVTHATGRISDVFGPAFRAQDGFRRQVRMPAPPLLLADRVMELDAEPGSMGTGRIVTETDIRPDSWYVHDGRMSTGMVIEGGQADLMLISFLGIDFINRGERVYRLLGCRTTFEDDLPGVGDTLRYEITIDEHHRIGETRLFSFRYDCTVDGRRCLSVRDGRAGFFSDDELAMARGVRWTAEGFKPCVAPRLDPPRVQPVPTTFTREQIGAFAEGRPYACFGQGFEMTEAHTRSPSVSPGNRLHLARVTSLSTAGGAWGRGHLAAEVDISADDWFFAGHFLEDPIMPGNLMLDAGAQAMAFYIAALGFTLDKDGWRFQPLKGQPFDVQCRGQIVPTTRTVVVELFVEEVISGPLPTLYADILVTANGIKTFHARRLGIQLVPDHPLEAMPELLKGHVESERTAQGDGVAFGYPAMLAAALGRPSAAYGSSCAQFDGSPRQGPRLPGPPYHCMSRVTHIDGEAGQMRAGARVEAAYDIPPDAWYFGDGGIAVMPLALLLEVALQPCGWLAGYLLDLVSAGAGFAFRNLDGVATMHAEVRPGDGVLRTTAQLTSVSRAGGIILVSFDVHCHVSGRLVYETRPGFGFFPREALETQAGLEHGDARHLFEQRDDIAVRPVDRTLSGTGLAAERLKMLDRITGFWPTGGAAGLGAARAEQDVRADAWYFKAHFFQDPVQPGSLGLEAMIQLARWTLLEIGLAGTLTEPSFEPVAIGEQMIWKYRGQVLPTNTTVTTTIEVTRAESGGGGHALLVCDGSMWVDGVRIYAVQGISVRTRTASPGAA